MFGELISGRITHNNPNKFVTASISPKVNVKYFGGISEELKSEGVNWGMGWVVVGTAIFGAPRFLAKNPEKYSIFPTKICKIGAPQKQPFLPPPIPLPQLTPSYESFSFWGVTVTGVAKISNIDVIQRFATQGHAEERQKEREREREIYIYIWERPQLVGTFWSKISIFPQFYS